MKTLKYIIFLILPLFALCGCEDDSGSNPVFGQEDYPFIYITWQENMAYKLGSTILLEPQVSPTDGVEYKWTLDGDVISTKRVLEYKLDEYLLNAELKLEVSRYGKENSRTAKILVVKDFVPKEVNHKAVAWLTANGREADVNWESISHLIISSVIVNEDGSLDTSVLEQLNIPVLLSFAHHYGVQVSLEVSGVLASHMNAVPAYDSWNFYNNAVNKTDALIASIIQLVKANEFDGLNIYMDKAINGNYENVDALKAFYQKLGENLKSSKNSIEGNDYDYQLSMSVYGGWTNASLMNMVNLPEYNWINVLAFAAENTVPGPHASNWFATDQVNQWKNWYGVAPQRIVMGVPAFGLRYFGKPEQYNWGNLWQFTEYIPYADICNKYPDAPNMNTIIEKENNDDPAVEVDKTYYDGLNDVKAKAQFIVDGSLGGVALWSIESDSKDPAKSLMNAINETLNK